MEYTDKENERVETAVEREQSIPVQEVNRSSDLENSLKEGHQHHRHHHHHHHRSKHHRSSRKRSKGGFKKFWSKNKKIFKPFVIFLCVALLLGCIVLAVELIVNLDRNNSPDELQGTDGTVILSVSIFEEPVSLIHSAAKDIITNPDLDIAPHVLLKNYDTQDSRLDICQPVQISFHVVNKPQAYTIDHFVVKVTEENAPEDTLQYTLDAKQKKIDLYNLKTGTRYEYKVEVHFTNSVVNWVGGSFQTEPGPRILSIGGLRNVRDIGGWKTTDGQLIKQGLLYRGTEMDGKNDEFKLTEEGKKVLLDILKVKTDLDLRWPKEIPEGVDPLGETVEHIYYGTPQYTSVFLDSGKETMRKIFADLADLENYPIYLHCIYGRDRTGTVSALLLALLGVAEDDLYREYQLTALHNRNLDSAFGGFVEQLHQFEGVTIQEKTERYLLSIGVTEDEISTIRHIFLG